jgi:hypothetical protein
VPTALSEVGVPAFAGFYAAGTALDPISIEASYAEFPHPPVVEPPVQAPPPSAPEGKPAKGSKKSRKSKQAMRRKARCAKGKVRRRGKCGKPKRRAKRPGARR